VNISSVVVHTRSEHFTEVLEKLQQSDICEVHFHDPNGKIVVTIESDGVDGDLNHMKAIQDMKHVASASFVYSTSADEDE
jgi:periplasmic nitrate reductase NapD